MTGLIISSLVSLALGAPSVGQKTECVMELKSYKNKNGKDAFKDSTASSICQKSSSTKFLSCVKLAERPLESAKAATDFCGKDKNHKYLTCLQDLSVYMNKDGVQELKGQKLIRACQKGQGGTFLSCVAKTQRSLASVNKAVDFCKDEPTPSEQKCVAELGSYTSKKGKPALRTNEVVKTCMRNSSDKFLACVASTRSSLDGLNASLKSCGTISKNRMPASVKKKKRR